MGCGEGTSRSSVEFQSHRLDSVGVKVCVFGRGRVETEVVDNC